MTECFPEKCEVTKCANQRFQKKEWIDFSLVYRGMMGYGVRTEQDVRKGDFIMEYVGDIIDEDEKTERQQREGVRHHYTMLLNPGEYIDPSLQVKKNGEVGGIFYLFFVPGKFWPLFES